MVDIKMSPKFVFNGKRRIWKEISKLEAEKQDLIAKKEDFEMMILNEKEYNESMIRHGGKPSPENTVIRLAMEQNQRRLDSCNQRIAELTPMLKTK